MIKAGIIGLGTVGTGVVNVLDGFSDRFEITKIAVKNLNKKRNVPEKYLKVLTDDAFAVVEDPEIDIVIEVAGGTNPAFELLKTAISNKKHIVTANKELLAKHGEELFSLAEKNDVAILYEAAIGGGIPVVMPVKTVLAANKINKIKAILNGTTNYILTKMDENGTSYETALKEAQALGYAETDPTGDVEGFDALYKICTLATIAFGKRVKLRDIYREGITEITAQDINFANEFGYKIKLVASAEIDDQNRADVRVHPVFVPKDHVLAKTNDVTNAVMLSGFPVGDITLTGPGAGANPTASSVAGDVLAIASELETPHPLPMMRCSHTENAIPVPISETQNRYYISLNTNDYPGAIGVIGTICGAHGINITDLLQKGTNPDNTAEVIVITAKCRESNVFDALEELKKSAAVNKINNLIRVMN